MTVYISESLVTQIKESEQEKYLFMVKNNMVAQLFNELLRRGRNEVEVKIQFIIKEEEWYGIMEKELTMIAEVKDET